MSDRSLVLALGNFAPHVSLRLGDDHAVQDHPVRLACLQGCSELSPLCPCPTSSHSLACDVRICCRTQQSPCLLQQSHWSAEKHSPFQCSWLSVFLDQSSSTRVIPSHEVLDRVLCEESVSCAWRKAVMPMCLRGGDLMRFV